MPVGYFQRSFHYFCTHGINGNIHILAIKGTILPYPVKQKFEYIYVVGTAETVVGTEYHHGQGLDLPNLKQRGGEFGVGCDEAAYNSLDLVAEWQKTTQCLLGLVHLGRGDHLHRTGNLL